LLDLVQAARLRVDDAGVFGALTFQAHGQVLIAALGLLTSSV
jgi:hypothetical protein